MQREMLVSGCSQHPACAHKKVKPCGLGCGVLDTSRPCRPREQQHGLMLSHHQTCLASRAPERGSKQSLCTGLRVNKCLTADRPALASRLEPCADAVCMSHVFPISLLHSVPKSSCPEAFALKGHNHIVLPLIIALPSICTSLYDSLPIVLFLI